MPKDIPHCGCTPEDMQIILAGVVEQLSHHHPGRTFFIASRPVAGNDGPLSSAGNIDAPTAGILAHALIEMRSRLPNAPTSERRH